MNPGGFPENAREEAERIRLSKSIRAFQEEWRANLDREDMEKTVPCFAIVRVDNFFVDDPLLKTTIKKIVWNEERAESEVKRLNELVLDNDCYYKLVLTRAEVNIK